MEDATKKQLLRVWVQGIPDNERTPQKIRNRISEVSDTNEFNLDENQIEKYARMFEIQFNVRQDFGYVVVRKENSEPWWKKAVTNGLKTHYSERFHQYILQDETAQLPITVANRTNEVTDQIIDLVGNPNVEGHWKRRGMVIGHVQSGKTLNYSSVITKAADAGYRVILLLAGITNSLRRQTQDRIDHAFIGRQSSEMNISTTRIGAANYVMNEERPRHPNYLTSLEKDFLKSSALATRGWQVGTSSEPMIFVCKKNVATLRNVYEFLEDMGGAGGFRQPFLMIDDEADNASINTLLHKDKVTAINQSLRRVLSLFERSSYLGYTATPFANIFIDPETEDEMGNDDLFPSDFIKTLEAPTNYVGPNELFGAHGHLRETMVLLPEDYDTLLPLKHKSDHYLSDLPESLERAVLLFILAKAVRVYRGQHREHCSMMVNISRFNNVQSRAHFLISKYLEKVRNDINSYAELKKYPGESILHQLKTLYENEFLGKARDKDLSQYPDWSELLLSKAVRFMRIMLVNMTSKPLSYDNEPDGLTVIAIGGLALSRGLTLEGLTISYILRNASAYDTLMQMGRWFGYRDGYEDLCRLSIPEASKNYYVKTTEAISELRDELQIMQDLDRTPAEFGLKIRSHPEALAITAANKMKTAQKIDHYHGLGGKTVEGHAVFKSDTTNRSNIKLTSDFLESLGAPATKSQEIRQPDFFWNDVPKQKVLDFISKFKLPSPCNEFEYIPETKNSVFGEFVRLGGVHLANWQVAIANGKEPDETEGSNLLPDTKLVRFRRESGKVQKFSYGEVFSFTNSRKVSTPVHAEFGLKFTDIKELKDNRGLTKYGSPKQISSVLYNSKRTIPLLLIYEIDARHNETAVFSERTVSFAVHFPDNDSFERIKVSYAQNKVAQQQELPLHDEEGDGDEARELNALQEEN